MPKFHSKKLWAEKTLSVSIKIVIGVIGLAALSLPILTLRVSKEVFQITKADLISTLSDASTFDQAYVLKHTRSCINRSIAFVHNEMLNGYFIETSTFNSDRLQKISEKHLAACAKDFVLTSPDLEEAARRNILFGNKMPFHDIENLRLSLNEI